MYSWGRNQGAWHFDNVPVCGSVDRRRYCKGGECASFQLGRHLRTLGDQRLSIRARNEALKWVVHLVGDIHQPLHAADRDDRGGNLVEVSFFGRRDNPPYGTINLHVIWDVHMVQRLIGEKGGEAAIVDAPIGDADRVTWEQSSIADWIRESNRLAAEAAYSIVPRDYACSGEIREVLAVDEAYYSKAASIIETRIKQAGVRLARVLNEALGSKNQ